VDGVWFARYRASAAPLSRPTYRIMYLRLTRQYAHSYILAKHRCLLYWIIGYYRFQ